MKSLNLGHQPAIQARDYHRAFARFIPELELCAAKGIATALKSQSERHCEWLSRKDFLSRMEINLSGIRPSGEQRQHPPAKCPII
jgi:hypothetical protein